MFKHILVPTDGSKLSLRAIDLAASMAAESGARLTVVTVSPAYPNMVTGDGYMLASIAPNVWEEGIAAHNTRIQTAVSKRLAIKKVAPRFDTVTHDQVYAGILESAKKLRCDLIVMSSHGRRGLSALLMGSETNKVLTHSKIPVLVCR